MLDKKNINRGNPQNNERHWFVYIILGTDGNYYTGITTNVIRRWNEHSGNLGKKTGAKYFRGRKPHKLVYVEGNHNRSSASKREIQIKKQTKIQKMELVMAVTNIADSFIVAP